MIHYREDSHSYQELLNFIRVELNQSVLKVLGSDDAKAIVSAISSVFPNTTHLFCTRHVRKNIERRLIKSHATTDPTSCSVGVYFRLNRVSYSVKKRKGIWPTFRCLKRNIKWHQKRGQLSRKSIPQLFWLVWQISIK